MKDEIKEILDRWNKVCNGELVSTNLTLDEMIMFRDYITNLQEENKEWSMIFDTFSKRPYAHKYLEQKKKELNNPNLIGLDSETIYKDYYDLKSRIEKAIELIKEAGCYDEETKTFCDDIWEELPKLLSILTGGDSDE